MQKHELRKTNEETAGKRRGGGSRWLGCCCPRQRLPPFSLFPPRIQQNKGRTIL